jgi:hypothetical protein
MYDLAATMLEARAIEGVPSNTGQIALIRLARAQQNFVDGTSNLFRLHDEMTKVGREVGVFNVDPATGIMEEAKPPSGLEDADLVHRAAA